MECQKRANAEKCNCTYPCHRKGMCCECLEYHRVAKELPACYFDAAAERTYDRTVVAYIRSLRKEGH